MSARPALRPAAAMAGVLAGLCLILTACAPPLLPAPAPGPSPPASTAPASPPLTEPGRARAAIDDLLAAAEACEVVRATITARQARITCLVDGAGPATFTWQDGQISVADGGTDIVNAVSFKPQNFAIDDVGALFDQAAAISGVRENQELQINEFNHSRVVMTVTTNPESTTVFFLQDGSLVPRLDLRTPEGIAAGFAEATDGLRSVAGMGVTAEGVWVDREVSHSEIEHRVRPATMPTYRSRFQRVSESETFDPQLVDPQVIAQLARTGAETLGKDPSHAVEITITQPVGASAPRIIVRCEGAETVLSLDGTPLAQR